MTRKLFIPLVLVLSCLFSACSSPTSTQVHPSPSHAKRILILGDSITYGGDYVVDLQMAFLAQGYTPELLNLGLSSETLCDLTTEENADHLRRHGFGRPALSERLSRVLLKTKPDMVLACYGMNDGGSLPRDKAGLDRFKAAAETFRNACLSAGAKRVVLCTPPVQDAKGKSDLAHHDEALTRFSTWLVGQRQRGWEIVDIHGPMRVELDLTRAKDPRFEFAKDGVHPGRPGHWIMAREILLQAFSTPIDGKTSSEEFFPGDSGKPIRELLKQGMGLLRDAWLSHTGHTRPKVAPGLPLPEAETKALALTKKLHSLLPTNLK